MDFKAISQERVEKVTWAIMNSTRELFQTADSSAPIIVSYLAYIYKKNGMSSSQEIKKYISESVSDTRRLFVEEKMHGNYDAIPVLAAKYSEAELVASALAQPIAEYKNGIEHNTPDSVIKLAKAILDIKKTDEVADFGSGIGSFMSDLAIEKTYKSFYGIELNTDSVEISRIRAELLDVDIIIEQGDMFMLNNEKLFDKVFSNYPFGMRVKELRKGETLLEALHSEDPEIKRATSSDWLYNALLVKHIKKKGKAVAVMTNGSTWNSIDASVRDYFIRNGFVEAVIAFPSRLFWSTGVATTMVVLSHGNKGVRMIDARKLCVEGRRQNEFSEKNIKEICRLMTEDSELSATISKETLRENDCVLFPDRYFGESIDIEDGVEFGSIIKHITRGAQIRASELDEMMADEPTDTQYLMLANIQDGLISEELPYLKELDPKYDKYCIGNRNLLLSKNGAPFKVAVAEVEKGRKILGNGNLFIIELDEDRADPFFIKVFFESDIGKRSLQRIVVGASIPNISVESLKKIMVPLPPIEKQKRVAQKYLAKIDEIRVLQLRIQKAKSDLKELYMEG